MKRTSCIFFIILIIVAGIIPERNLFAQAGHLQGYIDSLLKEIPRSKEDTNKVKLLNVTAFAYRGINPDEGIKYSNQALKLAKVLKWQNGLADAWLNMGVLYGYKADAVNMFNAYMESLKVAERNNYKPAMARAHSNIGSAYYSKGEYHKALESYSKSVKLIEELGEADYNGTDYGNIAEVYRALGKFDTAIAYYNRATAIFEKANDVEGIARNMANSAIIHADNGDIDMALKKTFKALEISRARGNKRDMALYAGNIGYYYYMIAEDSTKNRSKQQSIQQSILYSDSAIMFGKETKSIGLLSSFYENEYLAYKLAGNYKVALEYYEQHKLYKDSTTVLQNTEAIAQIENQRILDIKDKEIEIANLALAKKRNERVFYLGGILLLLAGIAITVRARKKSEKLLLNILPAKVAEELKAKGHSDAKLFDAVTVLFTDFVDFTSAGEHLGSQQLVHELDICFKAFDGITAKYNIEKIKTIGDAYLAVCGLPVADAQHAENVVAAAKEIVGFMKDRRDQLGDKTFEVRVGIHSGEVVAGIVGVKKFAYDIWGDTVNTAARMEQNSISGKINISQTTYQLVKDKFTCSYRGEIQAKNKGMLKMYFVEG